MRPAGRRFLLNVCSLRLLAAFLVFMHVWALGFVPAQAIGNVGADDTCASVLPARASPHQLGSPLAPLGQPVRFAPPYWRVWLFVLRVLCSDVFGGLGAKRMIARCSQSRFLASPCSPLGNGKFGFCATETSAVHHLQGPPTLVGLDCPPWPHVPVRCGIGVIWQGCLVQT